jgi:hypothetical protein
MDVRAFFFGECFLESPIQSISAILACSDRVSGIAPYLGDIFGRTAATQGRELGAEEDDQDSQAAHLQALICGQASKTSCPVNFVSLLLAKALRLSKRRCAQAGMLALYSAVPGSSRLRRS